MYGKKSFSKKSFMFFEKTEWTKLMGKAGGGVIGAKKISVGELDGGRTRQHYLKRKTQRTWGGTKCKEG